MTAKTIYKQTRPTQWPAPTDTTVTVKARINPTTGHISIQWQRDDHPDVPTLIVLTPEEFQGIAAAVRKASK